MKYWYNTDALLQENQLVMVQPEKEDAKLVKDLFAYQQTCHVCMQCR